MKPFIRTSRRAIPVSLEFERLARGAQFRDLIAVRVHASPDAIFRAMREVTLREMKLAWLIGELRYLPSRLGGHLPPAESQRPFVDILIEGGTLILSDQAPREMVTGSAARLHQIRDQAPVRFDSLDAFYAFDDPDHEKLFMSIRVAPTGVAGEQWLVLEHATKALSHAAEQKFRRYWRVIRPGGAFVSRQLLKAIGRRAQRADARSTHAIVVPAHK